MDTRALQRRLTALGYSPGPIDGDFGEMTRSALKAFQRDKGLKVDGVAGPMTRAALMSATPPQTDGELIPSGKWQVFAPRAIVGMREALNRAAMAYEVNTPLRICHWLGQMHVESKGFTDLEEDLSYSAKRLTEVWPGRYPTLAAAQPYANNPRALANHTYGGRNGNALPDDGWQYRGSGPKQITGRANFDFVERVTGHPVVGNPDLLRTDLQVGADAAGAYFKHKGCAPFADADDVTGLTRRINGGLIGLSDRRAATMRAKRIWGLA